MLHLFQKILDSYYLFFFFVTDGVDNTVSHIDQMVGKHAIKIAFSQKGYKKYPKYKNSGYVLVNIKDIFKKQAQPKGTKQDTQGDKNILDMFSGKLHCFTFFGNKYIYYTLFLSKGTVNYISIKKSRTLSDLEYIKPQN